MKKQFLIVGLVCVMFLSYVVVADNSSNLSYLFSWNDVPKNNTELLKFLKDNLKINWVENATINKSDNNKIITISKGNNSLTFRQNKTEKKVTLEITGGGVYEYILKEENGKINIYSKNTSDEHKNSNGAMNNTPLIENKNICENATCFCITKTETTTSEFEYKNKTLIKSESSQSQCILLSENEGINIIGKTENLTLTDGNNTYDIIKKNDVGNKEILKHVLLIAAIISILISFFAFWANNVFTKKKLDAEANQFISVLEKYPFLSILGFPQDNGKNKTLQERVFFRGLRVTLRYLALVFVVCLIGTFFLFPNELWYFIVLYCIA